LRLRHQRDKRPRAKRMSNQARELERADMTVEGTEISEK